MYYRGVLFFLKFFCSTIWKLKTRPSSLQSHFENDKKMYAIVEIAGQQFKVEKDRYIYTHRLAHEAGAEVTFDKILLVDNEGAIQVGAPTVSGASISGKVLEHLKGERIVVFRKRRRKGYKKRNGHRQEFSKVFISDINL